MKFLKKASSGNQKPPGFFKRNWKKTWFRILTIVFSLGLLAAAAWLLTSYSLARQIFTGDFSGGSQLLKLLTRTSDPLKGQNEGRINILLLGYGGAGHAGVYLTDTIQLVSVDTKNNKIAMISIPRDLYIETKNPYYAGKINGLYSLGKPADPKSKYDGATLIKDEVGTITGLPIHYYASLDFNGFKKAIDQIGGIDVTVDRTFTDYSYPADSGDGYMPAQTFKAGFQHMTGAKALIYARSRHAAGSEGSDFARSQRQQKVLAAFKTKIMSQGMLDNPAKVLQLIDTFSSSLRTDMQPTEIKALATLIKNIDTTKVISKVLDNGSGGLLTDLNSESGVYYLQPKGGINNWGPIQQLAKNIFNAENVTDTSAKIVILNGSNTSGLSLTLRDILVSDGYKISAVEKTTITSKTTILDYSSGAKKTTLDFLASKLNTSVSSGSSSKITNSWGADIIIVIGNDYQVKNGTIKESLKKQSGT